jgi:plastocyanin
VLRRLRRSILPVLVAAAAFAAVAPVGTASSERPDEVVKVGDDYFAPSGLEVKKGSTVKWKWLRDNLNTHNVVLTKKRPNGVKRGDFKSESGAIGIKFQRKFKKPGEYGFICTFHRSVMKMTVDVKR